MGGSTGHLGNMLLGFALAALIGAVAAFMFIILGDYNWSAAVFVGALIAVGLGALMGYIAGKPLESLADIQAKAAAAKPAVSMAAPAPTTAPTPTQVMAPVMAKAPVAAVAAPVSSTPAPMPVMAVAVVDDAAIAAAGDGTKPAALSGPRGGKADDLKNIEGIGPVLEKLCHEMGIYHFDQIAGWGAGEVAWMNANLKGFKGRVGRDKWVAQARLIGSVGMEEFKRRAETNDY